MNKITIDKIDNIHVAAKEFISLMGNHTVFAFEGAMGVGKTTFIKAVCEELGVEDIINSPTFSIINEYQNRKGESIYHFDFYRINKISEVQDIGVEEYFYSGNICLIEWPDIVRELLPENAVYADIQEINGGLRTIMF